MCHKLGVCESSIGKQGAANGAENGPLAGRFFGFCGYRVDQEANPLVLEYEVWERGEGGSGFI